MTEIDKEISEMKLCLNGRGRISAVEFLKNVSSLHLYCMIHVPQWCNFQSCRYDFVLNMNHARHINNTPVWMQFNSHGGRVRGNP